MAEIEDFFKSAFSVDNVIFGFDQLDLKVILIRRGAQPFKDKWVVKGDFSLPKIKDRKLYEKLKKEHEAGKFAH